MRKFIIAATALALMSGAAFAKDEKPDYAGDKEKYSCGDETLSKYMKALYNDSGPSLFRMEVLYVKDASEMKRSADELRCKATIVHARGKVAGVVAYTYEDGHALIAFKPGSGKR